MKKISGNSDVLKKEHITILVLILIISLCIRLPNITWGLSTFNEFGKPHSFHPDEFKIVLGAKGYPKDIVLRTDFRYPTALHYTLGILTIPLHMLESEIPSPLAEDIYYIVGRLVAVLIGVLSVGFTYQLGEKVLSPTVGLLASGLLSVSLYHMRNSALITTDVPTSLLMLIVVLMALAIDANSSFWHYVKLGSMVGFLVGIKYTGAFVVIPVGVIFIEKFVLESDWNIRKKMLAGLATSIFVSIILFVITTPGIILAPSAFIESLAYELARTSRLQSDIFSLESWAYLFRTLKGATNFLFALFSVLGLFVGLQRNFRKLMPYIALVVFYIVYFNTSLLQRYVITIAPFLCLICASLVVRFLSSMNVYLRVMGILMAASLLGTGLFQGIVLVAIIQNDTRYQAAKFVANEIPLDSTISMKWEGADFSCGYQVNKMKEVVAIDANPDFMLLCGHSVEQLLSVSRSSLDYYQLVAEYTQKYPIDVEFLSPHIFIYKKVGDK